MNNEENTNEYFAYGHYGYYKKKILDYVFNLSDKIAYITNISTQSSYRNKHLPLKDVTAMYQFIGDLKIVIALLEPKLSSVEKKKDKYKFDGIENILDTDNDKLIYDYSSVFSYYRKLINLVEALGYSDMNVIQSANDSWGDNTNDFNPYI